MICSNTSPQSAPKIKTLKRRVGRDVRTTKSCSKSASSRSKLSEAGGLRGQDSNAQVSNEVLESPIMDDSLVGDQDLDGCESKLTMSVGTMR